MAMQTTGDSTAANLSADWLAKFQAVGGFILDDGTIGNRILGYSESDHAQASEMIAELAEKMRCTVH